MHLWLRASRTVAAIATTAAISGCAPAPNELAPARVDAGFSDSGASDAVPEGPTDSGIALDTSPVEGSVPEPKQLLRILFIGNSYTEYNALPTVLAKLSESPQSPISVEVAAHTPGGATWEDHDIDPAVEPLIQKGWDYVVLQDQSQQPWVWSQPGTKPSLISLDEKIKSAGAKTLLYMTWARQEAATLDPTRFEMDLAVNHYYERQGAGIDATVAPVGRSWERALRDTTMSLHVEDGSHPNERGTYLTACVFYTTLTNLSPVGLGAGGLAISPIDQARLQAVAWDTHLARKRSASPAVGAWPLSASSFMHDFVPMKQLTLGDTTGPKGAAQTATEFGPGRYGAIPYFVGLNVPNFTLAVHAFRNDWTLPPEKLYENLVRKPAAYRLAQNHLNLEAALTTENVSPPDLSHSVAGLSPGWHHFALTYDGTTFTLWVDATAVASAPATGDIKYYVSTPDDSRYDAIAIGTHTVDTATTWVNPALAVFNGALSGVALFDQALGATELMSL